jgi:hypothetical protein
LTEDPAARKFIATNPKKDITRIRCHLGGIFYSGGSAEGVDGAVLFHDVSFSAGQEILSLF